jgi:glycosyltransferase involved in cell wall biosynthesis
VSPEARQPRRREDAIDSAGTHRGVVGGTAAPGRARFRLRRLTTSRPLVPALAKLDDIVPTGRARRIILLSQYFSPEVGATQSRMQSFADYLAARGHHVTVICEVPNHPRGVIPSEYRGVLFEDDCSNAYRVLRVWVHEEKSQRTRLSFYASFMVLATAIAPAAGGADVVFATSPPLFVGLAGAAIARLKRAPLVLDIRDLWPAAAVSLGEITSNRAVAIAEKIERLLYRTASAVTCVTAPFCEHVNRYRRDRSPAIFLPNGTLEQFFVENGAPRERLNVSDGKFLATYAGTHGIAQGLPTLLEAAQMLADVANFAFVGEGPLKERLVQTARALELDNVRFNGEVPLHEVPALLRASDALLVPLSAHPTFADFVPSKLFDYMAVARPIVLSAVGEPARILDRANAGLVVRPEDPVALANAVRWLAEHREEASAMGERGRDFARRWPRLVQAERLECILEHTVEERVPR